MTSATPPPATPPPAPPSLDPPAWQAPPPPPDPPVPPPRPPLRRSRTDKIIGGVSGGLADYSGIDALLWRVGFIALAFAGGTGVIVYLLLWLLMPAGPPGPGDSFKERRAAGPRSPVPGITVAALLIVVGLLALLTRFTALDLGPRAFLGGALLVVGLGLVAAAFAGGRTAKGGLIALGTILSVGLIGASSAPLGGDGDGFGRHVGDRFYQPTSAEGVRPVYEGGLGDFTLDLSRIDLGDLDEPIETRLQNGVGDVQVIVPRSADVEVEASMGMGSADVLGQRGDPDGFYPGEGSAPWTGDDRPEIVLTLNSGLGDVEVSRG